MSQSMALDLTEAELDAARADREGAAWFHDTIGHVDPTIESMPINHAPSLTPISAAAFDLIVEFEVSSRALYQQRYRGATWPGESSGVTIGIGYDVGYSSARLMQEDWGRAIPLAMLNALLGAVGVTGLAAKAKAAALAGQIDIDFDTALGIHRNKIVPRWVGLTQDALPNTDALSADSLGALVSLTYNRGAQYSTPGDRAFEMRNIHDHMQARRFDLVPGEIRAMKHLWPNTPGLQNRREREAAMFQRGLAA